MWFFDGWAGLARVLVVGTLAYAALVFLLRVSGKRTLSKMNAFDFVVTVAIGSTLATTMLSKSVALFEGVLAFALLVGLQYVITWLSVRSDAVQALVKAEPSLLYFNDGFLERELRQERVTKVEVLAAIRAQGIGSMGDVDAVVLETDGTFTVLKKTGHSGESTLDNVRPHDHRHRDSPGNRSVAASALSQ